jgi:hypothetical protein
LDQGALAFESGLLFHQSFDLRSAIAYRVRKRAVSEPLGMLEYIARLNPDGTLDTSFNP